MCSRRPHSRYLLCTLVPTVKAIKKLEGAMGVGQRAVGEATALSNRLEVMGSMYIYIYSRASTLLGYTNHSLEARGI